MLFYKRNKGLKIKSKFKRSIKYDLISTHFTNLIFPENIYCACCGDSIDPKTRIHGLCDKCISMIQWVSDNPLESRMDEFAFDDFLMCCVYGFAPRKIISKLKFEGANYLAKPLAKLMAEQSSRFNESFDAVCFIPSSKEKLAKRGYNQSELLARHIAKSLGLPLLNALQKPAETKSLRLSSGRERQGIISGAFELNNKCEIKKGSVLLLVDDVLTTGSTASEASRILHYGGAAKVCVLVFAGPSGVMYQQYDKE